MTEFANNNIGNETQNQMGISTPRCISHPSRMIHYQTY